MCFALYIFDLYTCLTVGVACNVLDRICLICIWLLSIISCCVIICCISVHKFVAELGINFEHIYQKVHIHTQPFNGPLSEDMSKIFMHTHTHPFNGPLSETTGWAGTRKVKPIWILLKQETMSGSTVIKFLWCLLIPRKQLRLLFFDAVDSLTPCSHSRLLQTGMHVHCTWGLCGT